MIVEGLWGFVLRLLCVLSLSLSLSRSLSLELSRSTGWGLDGPDLSGRERTGSSAPSTIHLRESKRPPFSSLRNTNHTNTRAYFPIQP